MISEASPDKNVRPYQKQTKAERAEGIVQVTKYLPTKAQGPETIPSITHTHTHTHTHKSQRIS
jgi:hypothetical protein